MVSHYLTQLSPETILQQVFLLGTGGLVKCDLKKKKNGARCFSTL